MQAFERIKEIQVAKYVSLLHYHVYCSICRPRGKSTAWFSTEDADFSYNNAGITTQHQFIVDI